jgi:maltose alpha-D-glucosyltransferase/alpha-amylase
VDMISQPPATAEDPLWYKDAVIYQLHIKSFFDADNDGVGDFKGLLQKLDYVAELGVTAIWLLPFYPRRGAMTATTSPTTGAYIRITARWRM